ncbi:DUF3553 domain-containing protein [Desertibaculum subflavum]|uniref:DUF3553 domain-containing protein n=1 Tax=Desertibaculum subflavum TaxID=2268458 RepID=UPI000E663137
MPSVTFAGAGPGPAPGLVPGALVRHPREPDWGIGQVQSAIDGRVTVNFEQVGKRLINAAEVALEIVGGREDSR